METVEVSMQVVEPPLEVAEMYCSQRGVFLFHDSTRNLQWKHTEIVKASVEVSEVFTEVVEAPLPWKLPHFHGIFQVMFCRGYILGKGIGVLQNFHKFWVRV